MSYTVKARVAIVTGGGSGCSVMIADLRLRPEAEATINEYPHINAESSSVSAVFCRTDMSNWRDILEMWETTTRDFGRVDIVVNGAGIYEPPSSSFWNPPGISARSKDPQYADVGQYKTFAVNTIGSTRLAQIAIDYWQQHPDIQGNILFIASMGGYLHSIHTPLYFASKAAIVSLVKSLGGLKEVLGIRMAAVCPGPVLTPIFEQEYCKDRLQAGDVALTAEQCAEFVLQVLQEPQYGNGNIMEVMMIGAKEDQTIHTREVVMESLYPTVGPLDQGSRAIEETEIFVKQLREKGMRM
ncbi:hypothetical protein EDB80DRAFT_563544 [Ilyonectria destructans]|nr:hypothetical protein EDB80DRAFT_563544 [Ilyonectria destructans]